MKMTEILDVVKTVMKKLGLTDHLPTTRQILEHGYITYYQLSKVGGVRSLSLLMGLPMAPVVKPKKYNTAGSDPDAAFISDEGVIPSQAFKKQAESGRLYGEIQKEETLDMAGRIDVSQYAGMQTYAERMEARG